MATPEDLEVIKIIEAALMKRWPENKIEPSLNRILALIDALGSPQLSYPTVHIGGTNGKTSTGVKIR
jgi:dihydrofolate synthase/folylpolyglutamate synthase